MSERNIEGTCNLPCELDSYINDVEHFEAMLALGALAKESNIKLTEQEQRKSDVMQQLCDFKQPVIDGAKDEALVRPCKGYLEHPVLFRMHGTQFEIRCPLLAANLNGWG